MIVWRLPPKAVHTDRHQSSIAASRSGPAGAARASATVMLPDPRANTRVATLLFHVRVHVCLLDLTAGKLLFNMEVKANQTEYNAD